MVEVHEISTEMISLLSGINRMWQLLCCVSSEERHCKVTDCRKTEICILLSLALSRNVLNLVIRFLLLHALQTVN